MLKSIQPYTQSYAEIIRQVTGIDVEIVDSHMVRIAGTGVYTEGVGSSLAKAGEIYKEVLATRQTVLIESPRSHPICQLCSDRERCREHLSLSTPIACGSSVLGVIGLVCFTDCERQRVLESRDSYLAFIALLADSLAHKVEDHRRLNHATNLLDSLLHMVNASQQGIVIFDSQGTPTYISSSARQWLQESGVDQLSLDSLHRTGDSLSDLDEFELMLSRREGDDDERPTRITLMGQMAQLDDPDALEPDALRPTPLNPYTFSPSAFPLSDQYSKLTSQRPPQLTLFSFDLPTRLAQRMGDITVGSVPSGFAELIGQSPAMQAVKKKAAKVSQSTSTVLITGESGTGKELMARAIHQAGPRRNGPFVAINCGAIPDTLLESELFGYVGGAFTGASSKGRMGRFELAQGGIIFLDEISTMPLYLQVKLLRVLQERKITRLGSNRQVDIDVRIISASNDDLWACTKQNTFREDLFYRLNVIQLNMPPLRERRDDIPVLAEYFLTKYCTLFQKRKPVLSQRLLKHLEGYAWPGNVRELEHVLEYAVNMMADGEPLRVDCLPQRLWRVLAPPMAKDVAPSCERANMGAGAPPSFLPSPSAPQAIMPLHVLEEQAVQQALEYFGNSTAGKREAAKALGLSMATLYRKLGISQKKN